MKSLSEAHLRSLCFYDVIGYPPTLPELSLAADEGVSTDPKKESSSISDDGIRFERGRVVFQDREELIPEHERRERLFSRKIRRARRVAKWLSRLQGVRFIAVCNTTAMAHANEEGDLDFFMIVREGSLWQTRGWAALPFKLLGLRPTTTFVRDAVCLSFFVDDVSLDLSHVALKGDDVYLRHWFLSLLPLYDDGIGKTLWETNTILRQRHMRAQPWVIHPDLRIRTSFLRLPFFSFLDPYARRLQMSRLSPDISRSMNQGTNVVVNEHVLKFHVQDGRVAIRQAYEERCQRYGIAP